MVALSARHRAPTFPFLLPPVFIPVVCVHPVQAVQDAFRPVIRTLNLNLQSLGFVGKGLNLLNSVSSPLASRALQFEQYPFVSNQP
jgi:hypothetical protein